MTLTELIVKKEKNKNVVREQVFTFDGSLGGPVWESSPITRFRFSKPVENDYFKEQLAANHPTAGIVFQGIPYIGTSDGFVCTVNTSIQRIPEILVDTDIFVKEYKFRDAEERKAFERFNEELGKPGSLRLLVEKDQIVLNRLREIYDLLNIVAAQERNLDCYLSGALAIRGFVTNKDADSATLTLYDGHPLGISNTSSGEIINYLEPEALYQVSPELAGFVPNWNPVKGAMRNTLESGILQSIPVPCVDYRSLWSLGGKARIVEGICPRDGSGFASAKFATDGKTIAVSHGNHPYYALDIFTQDKGKKEKIKHIDLDPQKTPSKLLIKEGSVLGLCGNEIRDFSKKEDIFKPKQGSILSLADSGLCTVFTADGKTEVYDPFRNEEIAELKGDYRFLSATPQ